MGCIPRKSSCSTPRYVGLLSHVRIYSTLRPTTFVPQIHNQNLIWQGVLVKFRKLLIFVHLTICFCYISVITTAAKQGNSKADGGSPSLATAATEREALGADYEKLGIHPHVYETSSLAYLGLAHDGNNQAILVTGESGAGKTETIKIVMNHLAKVERSRPLWPESDRTSANKQGAEQVVNRILCSNPLFESFGNAKTLRNDNSSR